METTTEKPQKIELPTLPKKRGRPKSNPSQEPAAEAAPQPELAKPETAYVADPFNSVASIAPQKDSGSDVGAPLLESSESLFQGVQKEKHWDGFSFYVYNRDAITITSTGEQRVIGSFSSPLKHECFDLEFQERAGNKVLLIRLSDQAQHSSSSLLPPFEEHLQLYTTRIAIDFSKHESISYHLDRAQRGIGIRPFPVVSNSERDSNKVGAMDDEIARSRPLSLGRWEPQSRTMT